MKHSAISAALAAVLFAGCSQSGNPNPQQAAAPASKVVCSEQRVERKQEWGTGGIAGTAIGGAAGGLLGNQFGKGKGNTAMTAAGAVGGAVAGHEIGKDQDTRVAYAEHCHDVPAN